MRRYTAAWSLAGVVAGVAGLATSYLVAQLMNLRLNPVTAVAELLVDVTPTPIVNWAKETLGVGDKPITIAGILVILVVVFAVVGRLARATWWVPVAAYGVIAAVGVVATLTANGAVATDLLPIAVGYVTWVIALALLTERLRRLDALDEVDVYGEQWHARRREFLLVSAAIAGVAAVGGLAGRFAGQGRRAAEEARGYLRLPVSAPQPPVDVRVDVAGVEPWMTPNSDFYLIDTAFSKPAIRPQDWVLRIHGMVEREVEITYQDLVDAEISERWVTLNCVSNEVGGSLIGNAWWSGVELAPLLAQAGVLEGADAVLQTSEDGWTCGTPLEAMTDDRGAMLAIAMNGDPLPIEHGFPVRTIVPGLYGYVSATKWVVDMEVTRFADFEAYWTQNGWSELGPVKIASRIDVPASGETVTSGEVVVAGSAWHQGTGVSGVEVAVDGGAWMAAELAGVPSVDTWVQWKATVQVGDGDHQVVVRALDADGEPQTGVVRDVLPDGATGLDRVSFSASADA